MNFVKKKLVTIPDDKGVVIKIAGAKGERYVYKQIAYFRNEAGKPRNRTKIIGKIDPDTGKMFPNSNYFQLFNLLPTLPDVKIWDYGYTYLVLKVCRDMGLHDCLSYVFGKQTSADICVMAAYIIREGNAMDGIDDWQQRNFFPDIDRQLTSQYTSRVFASLTLQQRMNFFKNWVKKSLTSGNVCYDVTSISPYSQSMISVERGYNRDGDDLAQFNLGMFCDETLKTPLYYNRYSGSLTDRTNLASVLNNAKNVGIEKVKMVLDGGFWSEECLKNLNELCEAFTVGMPITLKESEKMNAEHGAEIMKYADELPDHHTYCVSTEKDICGVSGKVLLFFNSQNHINQCNDLSELIDRLKGELSALKHYPKGKLSRFSPYFIITKHEQDSGFDFVVDPEKIEKLRSKKGYFMLFSTDMRASPAEILDYYRAKDADEKVFAQIKVDMDGNRIRTHSEATTNGKTFVTFIACIIRAYMLRKMSEYLANNSTSLKKALNQLSNIVIIANNDGEYRFAQALTKKQKAILAAFNAVDGIVASLP